MANPYFQFKQFTVYHDRCAMKVGTDGVLLGAWADVKDARSILDIGTGTGLIALMSAQRCSALIDAIDIDEDACRQAQDNVASSPFNGRISVFHASLADYLTLNNSHRYDRILSNPPFFIRSLKCPDDKRSLARHTDTLPLPELLQGSLHLLAPGGRLSLILPYSQKEMLETESRKYGYALSRETAVCPTTNSQPKRLLAELSLTLCERPQSTRLILEMERHQYSEEFKALVRDFYLKL